jgi:hypothetical protein
MNQLTELAPALRRQAEGCLCHEAAVELLIAQRSWLRRSDFTQRFVHVDHLHPDGPDLAVIDWPLALTALQKGHLPCSGGEHRMLRIAASLADGIPVDLNDALTGLDAMPLSLS